ncbi:MAG: NADH-quinone oxidoreductase subunit J [Gemmataceae bacterium]
MPSLANLLTSLAQEWTLWLPLLVGALAIFVLLPRPRPYPWYVGALLGGLALFLITGFMLRSTGLSPEIVLFYAFSFLSLLGGVLLITQHNPARAALSFTLVVLSSCGLFLLLGAPFLMAATIIIYAGAIIVTFLFVLMLAQQAGLSDADARSREPALATFTGFLLLAAMVYVLRGYQPTLQVDDLLGRINSALEQKSRQEMVAIVEPQQTDVERDREDRQAFRQAARLLERAGLHEQARKARHAGDDFVLADSVEDQPGEKTLQQSRLALEKLREVVASNAGLIEDRQMVARLPSAEEPLEQLQQARRAAPPMSAMSGAPPTLPPSEIRRDAKTGVPHLPAENSAFLGRSLFTDFLLPIELGGTLLLVATVGAIAIAQRRVTERRVG